LFFVVALALQKIVQLQNKAVTNKKKTVFLIGANHLCSTITHKNAQYPN